MQLSAETAVVVRHRIEVEIVDQLVEPDRNPSAPREIVVFHRLVNSEDLAGQRDTFCHLSIRDLVDAHAQIIELEHFDMCAELCRHERQIGRDVEHSRVEVAHQSRAGIPQSGAYRSRVDPLRDALPGAVFAQPSGHRAKFDAGPPEHVRDLGHRALSAVGEPLAGAEAGVVHLLGRLEVDNKHGRSGALRDRQHHRRGEVGGEKHHDQVAVTQPQLLGGNVRILRVRDEAGVDHFSVELTEALGYVFRRFLQLRQQVRKLRPVSAEPPGESTRSTSALTRPAATVRSMMSLIVSPPAVPAGASPS